MSDEIPHSNPEEQLESIEAKLFADDNSVENQDNSQAENEPDKISAGEMSVEQLAEAKRYSRDDLICTLLDKAIDFIFLGVMAFVFAIPLTNWLETTTGVKNQTLLLLMLAVTVYLIHMAVSFPLSYYSGFVLEHKFQLSRQTLSAWFKRFAKRNLIGMAFTIILLLGLYWVIWLSGQWWWVLAAAASFVVMILVGQIAPVLIMPLFYKIEKIEDPDMSQRMANLSEGTGLSIEGVYRMDLSSETVKANAMLAGLGSTRRVIMGDTLLDQFSPEEIEVVFAHEIGHHVHRHIRKMIGTGLLFSLFSFYLCHLILDSWITRNGGVYNPNQLPVYVLPLLMFCMGSISLVFEPIQNMISRHYERQSDTYALKRTGNRESFITAFQKLSKLNKDDPDPHPVEVFLLHSHPPISARIALAEGLDIATK